MELFLGLVGSFLGGCLVTAFGFVLPIKGDISGMKKQLELIDKKIDEHIKAGNQPCQYHTRIETEIAVLKTRRSNG